MRNAHMTCTGEIRGKEAREGERERGDLGSPAHEPLKKNPSPKDILSPKIGTDRLTTRSDRLLATPNQGSEKKTTMTSDGVRNHVETPIWQSSLLLPVLRPGETHQLTRTHTLSLSDSDSLSLSLCLTVSLSL